MNNSTNSTQEDVVDATTVETEENSTKVGVEEFQVSGEDLMVKIKELIRQGNIRRILIKNANGQTLMEIPLTVGVVGGVLGVTLFWQLLALGAIAALVARLTLVIERNQ